MSDYTVVELAAKAVGSGEIELSWQPPLDVIAAIKYTIKYRTAGGRDATVSAGGDTHIVVGSLLPSTEYSFDVIVSTMLGVTSTEAASVTCTTGQSMPTACPTDVTCEFSSSAFSLKKGGEYDVAVKVGWTPPPLKEGVASGYVVYIRELDSNSTAGPKTHVVDGAGSKECTVNGLVSHASYGCSVAVRNDIGEGPPSAEVVLKTAEQEGNPQFQFDKMPVISPPHRSLPSKPSPKSAAGQTHTHAKTTTTAAVSTPSVATPAVAEPHAAQPNQEEEWTSAEASVRLASQRRQVEREQAESWERKRTGTVDGSPFLNGHSTAVQKTALAPKATPVPATAAPEPATPTPLAASAVGFRPGGAVAAAREAAALADATAEHAREEEKRQMEEWERKKLAAVRGQAPQATATVSSVSTPVASVREPEVQADAPGLTRRVSKVIGRVTTSESEVEAGTPSERLPRRASKIIAMATTSESETTPGAPTLKRNEAEARRQAEIDAAASWEMRHGTIGGSSSLGDGPSMFDVLSTLEIEKDLGGGDEAVAAAAEAGPAVELPSAPSETGLETPQSSEEMDAEARRDVEQRQMALWEERVGKGGKVVDLPIAVDASPTRQPLKEGGQGSRLEQLTQSDRPRASSVGNDLSLVEQAPSRPTATRPVGGGFGFGAGGGGMQRGARAFSIGDISRTKNLSMKASPVGKAMVEFMAADTMEDMLVAFERTRTLAQVSRTGGPGFFEELKGKITPKLDYKRGHLLRIINKKMRKYAATPGIKSCEGVKVVVVGSGPVGLRQAIELALLKADVHIIEMRTTFSRYNILHLWDWVCHDLLELGVSNSEILGKSFYHIGTKELQLLLAKLALCMGIRISSGVKFEGVSKPAQQKSLWKVKVSLDKAGIAPHCGRELEANVLIEAGGINCPVVESLGFERKKVKMSTALGLVAHFDVGASDRTMEEFSVSSQFKQQKFKEMRDMGLHLENCVYYQGATHYYVMTPTPASLKAFGVLKRVEKHPSDTVRSSNMDTVKLHEYARGVATAFGLPAATPFIKDRNSAQLFDFSSRSQCKLSCKVMEDKGGPQLLVLVVGDALMEPFWPEGLGINRGFLSALDAAYTVQEYFSTGEVSKEGTKKMLKSKDKLFGLMRVLSGHTKKDVLREDFRSYTLLPNSRYLKWKTGY